MKYLEEHPEVKKVVMKLVDGGVEYFLIGMFLIYGTNYAYGARRNQQIADWWLEQVKHVIFANFAVIGTDQEKLQSQADIKFE